MNAVHLCLGELCLDVTHPFPPAMSKNKDYNNYITSSKWREFSSSIRHERGNRCEYCNKPSSEVMLHCHHLTYDRFGDENKEDIMVLCENHHSQYHSVFPTSSMPKNSTIGHVCSTLQKLNRPSISNIKESILIRKASPLGLRVSDHSAALENLKIRQSAPHGYVSSFVKTDKQKLLLAQARNIVRAMKRAEKGVPAKKDKRRLAKHRKPGLVKMIQRILDGDI